MTAMLEIKGLTKRFGPLTAVDDVSFEVDRGEVLGFLGPNGAGKSTTMKMVTGYLPPTAGTAVVCGFDVTEKPIEVKRRVGYLPEGAPLYEDMTPMGLLGFIADVRGLSGAAKRSAIERAAGLIKIEEVIYQPVGTLSKGYKRRVGLAQAILHDPEVLILDEPTDGLDPNQKHDVRELIRNMAADKAIIISTHILEEVDAVCSRAMIISRGRVLLDGSPGELEARSRFHNAVSVRLPAERAEAITAELKGLPGVASVEAFDRVNGIAHLVVFPADGGVIIGDVSAHIQSNGIAAEEIHVERGHLEDVFRDITTRV